MSTSTKLNTKVNIEGSDNDARARFCAMYSDPASGKGALTNALLSGGVILKETGLLDIVLNLDKSPEFRQASNNVKTRMLLVELGELFAGALPQPAEAPKKAFVTPSVDTTPQSQPEPVAATPEPPQAAAKPAKPVFDAPAQPAQPKVELPDSMLGS